MGSINLQSRAPGLHGKYTHLFSHSVSWMRSVDLPLALSLTPSPAGPGWSRGWVLVWSMPLPCLGLLVDPVPEPYSAPLHADDVRECTFDMGSTCIRVSPGSCLVPPHGADFAACQQSVTVDRRALTHSAWLKCGLMLMALMKL